MANRIGPSLMHLGIHLGIALTLAFALGTVALAQEKQEYTGDDAFDGDTEFTVDFPGGSIPEYLDAVRSAASRAGQQGPLNIVVTESAGEFQLPSIEIKTSMDGAIGCLLACSTDFQQVIVDSDPTGHLQIIKLQDRNPPIVQVMNVKSIISELKQEDFVSAIGIGLEMAGGDKNGVDMKLHEETGLFFVKGPRDRLHVIQQIVQQLGPNAALSQYGLYNNAINQLPSDQFNPGMPRPSYDPYPSYEQPTDSSRYDPSAIQGLPQSQPNDDNMPPPGFFEDQDPGR